jgi:Chaperone of endosialidase
MRAGNTAVNNLGLYLHYGGTGTGGENNQLRFGRASLASADMPWTAANPVIFDLDAPGGSIVLSGDGNVGLGTLTPAAPLHVNTSSPSGENVRLGASATEGGQMTLMDATGSGGWELDVIGSGASSRLRMFRDKSTPVTGLSVNASGNVGIGTDTPEQRLHVNGAMITTGAHFMRNTAPTSFYTDSDHRSAMIHVNSNQFYILRGNGVGSETWAAHNGWWPLQINLENNDISFGADTMSLRGSLNMYICNSTGCYLRLSDDAYFQDNNTQWTDYVNPSTGIRFYGAVIVHGRPSWHGQTSMRIHSPGGGLLEDWPGSWGGGLSTFDVVGASTYFSNYLTRSDRRYKKNIQPIDSMDALQSLMRLRPVNYRWKDNKMPKNLQYGLIAQEVREVLPELVTGRETKTERLGLNYDGFIAPLIASVQELKREQERIVEALPADGSSIPERGERWFRVILAAVIGVTSLALLLFALELRRVRAELKWWRSQAKQHGWSEPQASA